MAKITAVRSSDQINLDSCPECGSMDVYWISPNDGKEYEKYRMTCICEQCDADWEVEVKIKGD